MIRRFSSLSSLLITIITCSLFIIALFLLSYRTTHAFTISKSNVVNNLGLVGYWTFDGKDVSGGAILDKSGQGNTGYPTSIATSTFYKAGKIGQAGSFDGTNDYISIANNAALKPSLPVTVSVWIKPTTSTPSAIEPIYISDGTISDYYGFSLWHANTGVLWVNIGNGTGTGSTNRRSKIGTTVIDTTKWTHVVAVITSATDVEIYVNGVNDGGTFNGGNTSTSIVYSSAASTIGLRSQPPVPLYFQGGIDDVRVYNRALSASEINSLFRVGSARQNVSQKVITNGLVGHWTLDGKDMLNGVAKDVSGNGNDGNLIGIATSTFYKAGKVGQGGSFDGVNDYVNLGNPSSLQITNAITLSFWTKIPSIPTTGQALVDKNEGGGYGVIINNSSAVGGGRIETFFFINGAYANAGENTSNLSTNVWHHVVATFDGADTKYYRDGVLRDTVTRAGTISNIAFPILIGANPNGTTHNQFFNGSIDDVLIYNRALSSSEITQLYNEQAGNKQNISRKSANDNGLVGYWTFDGKDMPNGVAKDVSGNGNTGYPVSIATSTFYAAGKVGQGANFDGADDYIAPSSFNSLSGYPLTMSAWVKTSNTGNQGILFAGQSNSAQRYVALLVHSSAFAFSTRNDTGESPRISTIVPDGKWHHLVGVINADSSKIFYIDGVVAPLSTNGSTVSAPTMNSLNIGRVGGSSPGRNFDGFIDDPRIYTRALSAAEVQQLYLAGK